MTVRDMVSRKAPNDFDDFIPTPGYATRVLYEIVAPELKRDAPNLTILDPAAGQGHMLKVFREYGHKAIRGSDITEHPGVVQEDFLKASSVYTPDVIVTNPPYKHLNHFIDKSLDMARYGVGMLVRVQALEGQGRYQNIFKNRPPTQIALFSDRIPFKAGKVVRKAPKMFFHVWLWWGSFHDKPRPPIWIPPNAQQMFEKDEDYA